MIREEAISRQAVLEMAYDMSEIDGEHFTKPWMVVDVEDIQKLPSVKPQEPKTGHWKRIGYDIHECSICGQNVMTGDICAYKHCHGCGAKMIDEIKKAVKPQEKTKRCKECKYSEYCRRWGNKYKTEEDDYCFMFEPQDLERIEKKYAEPQERSDKE